MTRAPDERRTPTNQRLPGHPAATGRLDLLEPQPTAVGGRHADVVECPGDRRPGPCVIHRPPDDDPAGERLDERPRPRLVGANLPFQRSARSGRIQPAILTLQGVRQGDAIGRLGDRDDRTTEPRAELLGEELGSEAAQIRLETRGGLGPAERPGHSGDDRTGVQSFVHPHEGHAGLVIAGKDRGRDRGRAAVSRQQRWVQIERSVGQVQQGGRNQLAIVRQDHHLRPEPEHGSDGIGRPKALGRQDRVDPERSRSRLDDRRRDVLPTTGRAWRRGDDPDQVDRWMIGDGFERLEPERAAAQEHGPDARAVGPPHGHARALVASRTSASSSLPAPTTISSSIDSR